MPRCVIAIVIRWVAFTLHLELTSARTRASLVATDTSMSSTSLCAVIALEPLTTRLSDVTV
jgi:hypothetical protein